MSPRRILCSDEVEVGICPNVRSFVIKNEWDVEYNAGYNVA